MIPFTSNPQVLHVVLLGIDGSGKTTAARAVVEVLQAQGTEAVLYRNPGGRRTLNRWASRRFGTAEALLGKRLLDTVETILRVFAVARSSVLARRRRGVVFFDRHLQCQLALRRVRGLPAGRVVPWLLRLLPEPDLIVFLSVDPGTAHARIVSRATDEETLDFLTALDAAYRALPGFVDYAIVDANGTTRGTAEQLHGLVKARLQPVPAGSAGGSLPFEPLPVSERTQARQ